MGVQRIAHMLKDAFTFNSPGLSFKDKFKLSLPAPILSVSGVIIHQVFLKYYTDVIGLTPAMVGWVYTLYNIWNAVNDPLFGVLLDRRPPDPKRGKYVYLMKVTVPVMLLATFAMAWSSPSWSQWVIFGVFTGLLFIFDTAQTVYNIALSSYVLLRAPTKEERMDIGTIGNYVTYIMSWAVSVVPTLLLINHTTQRVFIPVFMVIMLFQSAIFVAALWGLPDPPELYASVELVHTDFRETLKMAWSILKSRPFLAAIAYSIIAMGALRFYTTAYLYYMGGAVKVDGITATIINTAAHVVALMLMPIMNSITKAYGTKLAIYWGMIPASIGYLGITFATTIWEISIFWTLIVISTIYFGVAIGPMNGLIIDEDEWRTGVRKTGLYNGMFNLCTTAFASIQLIIFTNVIGTAGYVGKAAVQTPQAQWGIRLATGAIPLLCLVVGLIPMIWYPFTRHREQEISAHSHAIRAAASQAAAQKLPGEPTGLDQ
ncbi:MAG: MFS transporter [Schleiferilactobacillus harbinensis]|jgi:GPH family glycoside/pentoside/hexuronide:cation symporter|uniref:MFS transporter n=1 Tax=Schleiferilactobacillus harbinensis TaxID=304207 RepID=UPI0039E775D4|nr:MFS transporter [Schleiferilactobacillus harbinensis]